MRISISLPDGTAHCQGLSGCCREHPPVALARNDDDDDDDNDDAGWFASSSSCGESSLWRVSYYYNYY